jgi:hypothetical protein
MEYDGAGNRKLGSFLKGALLSGLHPHWRLVELLPYRLKPTMESSDLYARRASCRDDSMRDGGWKLRATDDGAIGRLRDCTKQMWLLAGCGAGAA